MANELNGTECCAICGGEVGGSGAYCHFYPEGRRVALCSSECAEKFLRGPAHVANGDANADLIDELVEESSWSRWG